MNATPEPGTAWSVSACLSDRRVHGVFVAGVLAFSFWLTVQAGERGFLALDQSIVFDGGYRILSGQIPYKDFVAPFGFALFYVQALVFWLFGVSWFSYVVGAAAMNVLGTACSMLTARLLFPASRIPAYIAGLLTAVWLNPPFGTPWAEQTAFLFALMAITALVLSVYVPKRHPRAGGWLPVAAGMLAFLSFMSKQNAGLFMAPAYCLLMAGADAPQWAKVFRTMARFCAGTTGSAFALLGWLWWRSDLSKFAHYFLTVPSQEGIVRLFSGRDQDLLLSLKILAVGACARPLRYMMFACLLLAVTVLALHASNLRKFNESRRSWCIASLVCIGCMIGQNVFALCTWNLPENAVPFVGLVLACGTGLALGLVKGDWPAMPAAIDNLRTRYARLFRAGILTVAALCFVHASAYGIHVALTRKVHEAVAGAEFGDFMPVVRLNRLRWARPTKIRGVDVTEDMVVDLINWLDERDCRFFVFPDFSLLYGVLDAPSPQPLLWFHKGLTYPRDYHPGLDKWIVDSLADNEVDIIVIEEVSFFDTQKTLANFPELDAFIRTQFTNTRRMGIFTIYEKEH